jgi:hypothetical protein
MIGTAEDQECKEAFLAYYFLATAKGPPGQAELEDAVEGWLAQTFGVEVGFKVGDALDRLDRLGLLARNGTQLSALPPEAALRKLDRAWADFFRPQPESVA